MKKAAAAILIQHDARYPSDTAHRGPQRKHQVVPILPPKYARNPKREGLERSTNSLGMAPTGHDFVLGIHESDAGVRQRFAEFVARHLGADRVAFFAAGREIRDWRPYICLACARSRLYSYQFAQGGIKEGFWEEEGFSSYRSSRSTRRSRRVLDSRRRAIPRGRPYRRGCRRAGSRDGSGRSRARTEGYVTYSMFFPDVELEVDDARSSGGDAELLTPKGDGSQLLEFRRSE
nr:hypothetical protein CFP56_20236 [Quercus suber]